MREVELSHITISGQVMKNKKEHESVHLFPVFYAELTHKKIFP